MKEKIKAAFVGFGEVNTPIEIINEKCASARNELEGIGIQIISYNIVRDDEQAKTAEDAIKNIKPKDFDILIVCIAGWIPSWVVIKVTSEFFYKPILLWGLTGYVKDKKLYTTADQAGTSALRVVFEELGYRFKYIYNTIDKGTDLNSIESFACAAKAIKDLNGAKIGMMGYRDMNLYGTLYDASSLRGKVGVEIEHFEMLEIIEKTRFVDKKEIKKELEWIRDNWEFKREISDNILDKGVNFYLAIKEKIIERKYEAISLIDVDGMKKLIKFPPAMIFMLISDKLNVCCIPENDSLGSVTQLISKKLTGQIAAYVEFYEFMSDRILAGVPDFVPSEIVEGETIVTPTKFGDLGEGVLNISDVKTGIITLARLAYTKGQYLMHVIKGEAIKPRKWEEVGWAQPAPQLPSLEIILDTDIRQFTNNIMSQHYILTYGDNIEKYKDFCKIIGIKIL